MMESSDQEFSHPATGELDRLRAEMANHPGAAARDRMLELERAFDIWSPNCQKLLVLLRVAETNQDVISELIQNVRKPTVRDKFLRDLDSALQAFVGSTVALVDITRRAVKADIDSDFGREFTRRNNVVRAVVGVAVIRGLRNYLLHYASAPIVTRASFTPDGPLTGSVVLESATLLKYDGWDSASKKYIKANAEGVQLSAILPEFQAAMNDLYRWLFEAYGDLHDGDFGGYNDLVRRYNLALTGGTHDGSDWHEFMDHVGDNIRARKDGKPQTSWQDAKGNQGTPPV